MSSSKKVRLRLDKSLNVRSPRRSPQSNKYLNFLEGKERTKKGKSPQRGDLRVVKVIREKKVTSPQKQKVRVKTTPKVVTPKVVKVKSVAKEPDPPEKKKRIRRPPSTKRRVSRNKRSLKRVATKQSLNKKYTKTRRVSLKCVPQNKEKDVDKVLESIKKMSDKSIKEKLSKNGIIINSNKKQLLRDMYVFSELGGIKIHKE